MYIHIYIYIFVYKYTHVYIQVNIYIDRSKHLNRGWYAVAVGTVQYLRVHKFGQCIFTCVRLQGGKDP